MAEPTTEEINAAVAGTLAVLEASQATLSSADWQDHDEAVNAIHDATTTFYLLTQPATGVVQQRVILPDFEDGIYNFGCFGVLVKPLVLQIKAITDELHEGAALMPDQEAKDLANLRARVQAYEAALAQAPQSGPSMIVWERVTMPLLLGYYPPDFQSLGIVNPAVKSPPDIVRPYTLGFQAAVLGEAQRERWVELGHDLKSNLVDVVTFVLDAPGRAIKGVVEGVKAVGRGTAAVAVGALIVGGAFLYGKKKGR